MSPEPSAISKPYSSPVISNPIADATKSHSSTSVKSPQNLPRPQFIYTSANKTKYYFCPVPIVSDVKSLKRSPQSKANTPQDQKNLKMYKSPQVINSQFNNNYIHTPIGRAYVIDFWACPQATLNVQFLSNLGFQVTSCIENRQIGNSCGYNSASIISKLIHLINLGIDWCGADLRDVIYTLEPNCPNPLQHDLCSLGNIHLNKADDQPMFLSSRECQRLIRLYTELFYDHTLSETDLNYIGWPLSRTAFRHKINKLLEAYKDRGEHVDTTFHLVNNKDGIGNHWYVVGIEIYPRQNLHNED